MKKLLSIFGSIILLAVMLGTAQGATVTKGLIGAQDIHQPDGTTTRTFTRPSSTGGTITLNDVLYEVDALIAYGGGVNYTQATITAALTAIGTTNKVTLLLRPGTWVISSNADWSAYTNVTFKIVPGAILQIASTKLLTIGNVEAGAYKIFDCPTPTFASTDGVVFAKIQQAPLEWFGGVGDNANITSNNAAFSAAINALTTHSGTIVLSKGIYLIASNIYWKSYVNLYIHNGCQLKLKDNYADHIKMIDSCTNAATYGNVQNVKIWSDGQGIIDANKAGTDPNNRSHVIAGTGTNWVIEGLIIRNANTNGGSSLGDGITIDGQGGLIDIQNVTIKNNRITGCERFSISMETGSKVWIVDNYIDRGIDLEPDYNGLSAIRDVIISRNVVVDGGIGTVTGFPVIMERVTISDNILYLAGIHTNDIRGVTITGNRIIGASAGYHTGVIKVQNGLYRKTETLVIDATPAGGAWAAGDVITGVTSAKSATIDAKISNTVYTISGRTGAFTDGEVLGNVGSAKTIDCAAGYPQIPENDNVIISNNTITDVLDTGATDTYKGVILVWGYSGYVENVTISNNIIDTFNVEAGSGIHVAGLVRRVSITGNTLRGGTGARGISVSGGKYFTIANNHVEMVAQVASTFPGLISFSGDDAVIGKNNLIWLGTDAYSAGVNIYGGTNISYLGDDSVLNLGTGTITADVAVSGVHNLYGVFYGTLTLTGAAADYNITNTRVRGTASKVILTPRNAAAATLQAGANSLYHNSASDTDHSTFRLSTAGGGNAAGGEEFNFVLDTRKGM